ncbi:MAG: hypothetical protein AABY43_05445 [Candidatus Omnitrophota bacterium]
MKIKALLFIIFIVALGCATIKQNNTAQDELYSLKCTSCHRLYPVGLYAYKELLNYTHKYGRGLTADERSRLLGYFKANAKQK